MSCFVSGIFFLDANAIPTMGRCERWLCATVISGNLLINLSCPQSAPLPTYISPLNAFGVSMSFDCSLTSNVPQEQKKYGSALSQTMKPLDPVTRLCLPLWGLCPNPHYRFALAMMFYHSPQKRTICYQSKGFRSLKFISDLCNNPIHRPANYQR